MNRLLVLLALPALALGIYDYEWFEPNSWRCPFYSDGRWGIDVSMGFGMAGGSWPSPLENHYVFGSGVWVGAVVDGETLVTQGYDPNTFGTDLSPVLCRYWREGTDDTLDRVYVYPGDWPPPPDRFPMAPSGPESEAELWYGSGDSLLDTLWIPGPPLGIDVFTSVYAFTDSFSRDVFFLRYRLTNCSGRPLEHVYFGLCVDADVGHAVDDRQGFILAREFRIGPDTFVMRNTGFAYDQDNIESPGYQWESGTPGTVALTLLRAPESLGLAAYKAPAYAEWPFDTVPDNWRYRTMAGYNCSTLVYEPYDSIDPGPDDKRFVMSTGPFTLPAGATDSFDYAVIASPHGDAGEVGPKHDTSDLALRWLWAERVFQQRLAGVAEPRLPAALRTVAVRPNPFRAGMRLHIDVPGAAALGIYDADGTLVKTLAAREWDGTDGCGRMVPAGVYFVAGRDRARTKVLFIRD